MSKYRLNDMGLLEVRPGKFIEEPREHVEQTAVFKWAGKSEGDIPELQFLVGSMNGVPLSKIQRAMVSLRGRKSGDPDLFWAIARGGFHGLYIELKRLVSGSSDGDQKRWKTHLKAEGYAVFLCHGRDEAKAILLWYYHLPRTECAGDPVRLFNTELVRLHMDGLLGDNFPPQRLELFEKDPDWRSLL